ncbi:pyrimidine dimer DNA glycosylase/endonuclease V [Acidobacteriota bacterium]
MRIWDVSPSLLCRQHLLGEHRELHAVWNILTLGKKGYSTHPETKRWEGKLKALYNRHQDLVDEMQKRGYNHHTDLDTQLATGNSIQDVFLLTLDEQKNHLREKGCGCPYTG